MAAKKKKKRSARRGAPNTNVKKKSVNVINSSAGDVTPEGRASAAQVAAEAIEPEIREMPAASRFFIGEPEPRRARKRARDTEYEPPFAVALAERLAIIISAILAVSSAILVLCIASGARIDSVRVGSSDGAILFWSESAGGYEGRLLFTDRGAVDVRLKGDRVTLEYSNGDRYVGEAADFLPDGEGKMTYADGSSVEGHFVQGAPHGLASYVWSGGELYEGDFSFGVKSGEGKFTFADGGVYVGEFRDDRIEGNGEMHYASGDAYVGEWLDGVPYGEGSYYYANGDVYVGGFFEGYAHGVGTMYFANGDVYEGEFVQNAISGKGKYTWANGDTYEGEFPGK